MTADELRSYFNRVFGIKKEWPKTFEVDADTYANCCQEVFDSKPLVGMGIDLATDAIIYSIALGPNRGLMFKNVELILIGKK